MSISERESIINESALDQALTSLFVLRCSAVLPDYLVLYAQEMIDQDYAVRDTLERLGITAQEIINMSKEEYEYFVSLL